MVADDIRVNRVIAERFLCSMGAIVDLVEDGRAALNAVANAFLPYSLVLMDCHMPIMDGVRVSLIGVRPAPHFHHAPSVHCSLNHPGLSGLLAIRPAVVFRSSQSRHRRCRSTVSACNAARVYEQQPQGMQCLAAVDRCLAAGMDAHVAKPIDSASLAAVVQRWAVDVVDSGPDGGAA